MGLMFTNREEAGKKLANKIAKEIDLKDNLLVLAIPRGGVITGREIAKELKSPLDIIITKKIGAPGNPELAVGAIGPGEEEVIDEELAERVGADEQYLQDQKEEIIKEIKRREKELRGGKPQPEYKDKQIILTDDGVATGATLLAAIEVLRQHSPQKIIVAVPVIAKDTLEKIEKKADAVVFLEAPALFFAVGQFYRNFPQTSDQEVKEILEG